MNHGDSTAMEFWMRDATRAVVRYWIEDPFLPSPEVVLGFLHPYQARLESFPPKEEPANPRLRLL